MLSKGTKGSEPIGGEGRHLQSPFFPSQVGEQGFRVDGILEIYSWGPRFARTKTVLMSENSQSEMIEGNKVLEKKQLTRDAQGKFEADVVLHY